MMSRRAPSSPVPSRIHLSLLVALAIACSVPAPSAAHPPATRPGGGEVIDSPGFRRPVPGSGPPATPFDRPEQRWLSGHRGVDLAAETGSLVRAPGRGTVFFVGMVAGRPVVSVEHDGGLRTTYEPVTALVDRGDVVAVGTPLGRLTEGHTGCPTSTCLHWGALIGDHYLDPMSLLSAGDRPIRLKSLKPGDG